LVFSPAGKTLATVSGDKSVRLWDTVTGAEHARLGGHNAAVLSIAFGRDGQTLATGSEDGTVMLWELRASR
jgi:WD40 repeat protein